MKLTVLKGIGDNLASHLDQEIWFGHFKDIPPKIDINVLELKDELSKVCVDFFKKRIPTSFDFNRIKKINLKITKSSNSIKIAIKLKVDDKEITSYGMSMRNEHVLEVN